LMHPRFAQRLATNLRAKKKAAGADAAAAWWRERFPSLPKEQIEQVKRLLPR
jgi:hypothetical protein